MRGEEKVGVKVEHAALAEAHSPTSVGLAAVDTHNRKHVVEDSRGLEVVAVEGSVGRFKEEVTQKGDDYCDEEE